MRQNHICAYCGNTVRDLILAVSSLMLLSSAFLCTMSSLSSLIHTYYIGMHIGPGPTVSVDTDAAIKHSSKSWLTCSFVFSFPLQSPPPCSLSLTVDVLVALKAEMLIYNATLPSLFPQTPHPFTLPRVKKHVNESAGSTRLR